MNIFDGLAGSIGQVGVIEEDAANLVNTDPFDLAAMMNLVDEQSHCVADIGAIKIRDDENRAVRCR